MGQWVERVFDGPNISIHFVPISKKRKEKKPVIFLKYETPNSKTHYENPFIFPTPSHSFPPSHIPSIFLSNHSLLSTLITMAVKSRAQRNKQSKHQPRHEQEEIQRFVNEKAQVRFESEVKERKIHQEKGFSLTNEDHYGLPSEVATTIDAHQWLKFATHPHNPIVPLVHEVYANILIVNQTFSMVRGIKVSFSASSINMHFGLPHIVDECSTLVETISG